MILGRVRVAPCLVCVCVGGAFFAQVLEAEILVECLKFGTVVCVLTLPDVAYYYGAWAAAADDISSAESILSYAESV